MLILFIHILSFNKMCSGSCFSVLCRSVSSLLTLHNEKVASQCHYYWSWWGRKWLLTLKIICKYLIIPIDTIKNRSSAHFLSYNHIWLYKWKKSVSSWLKKKTNKTKAIDKTLDIYEIFQISMRKRMQESKNKSFFKVLFYFISNNSHPKTFERRRCHHHSWLPIFPGLLCSWVPVGLTYRA